MVKSRMEGRIERRGVGDDELVDMVRARLVQGYDRAQLPTQLHLLHGVDEDAVRRALAVVDEEHRVAARRDAREIARAAAFAAGAAAFASAVVAVWGGTGAAILSAGVSAAAIAVVVVELKRRGRS